MKRGTMIPLGEIQSFSAGMGVHTECMKHILMGTNLLDMPTDGSYTTNVVAEGGSDD